MKTFPIVLIPEGIVLAAISTSAVAQSTTAQSNTTQTVIVGVVAFLVLILFIYIYFLPTSIAFKKGHPNRWVIFAINLFGGALGGLGWIIALIWALRAFHAPIDHRYRDARDGGESGLNLFANDTKRVNVRREPSISQSVDPRPASDRPSAAQTLIELKRMRDAGEISAEEFNDLKGELFGR